VSVDIIKESGGRNRAVVKELTGVMVIDTLDVSLRAIRGRPPVLSGIEVVGAQE